MRGRVILAISLVILVLGTCGVLRIYAADSSDKIDLDDELEGGWGKEDKKVESGLGQLMRSLVDEGKVSEGIRVILELSDHGDLGEILDRGAEIEATHGNLVQVLVKPNLIRGLSELEFVEFIRSPLVPLLHESEGVEVMGADVLHDYSITGLGVKVAVLDLGFRGYTGLLGTDLPASVTVMSFSASGGIEATNLPLDSAKHGTACAEVVYDVAPGVDLYLVNFYTDVEFLNAVDWLIAQDVDVISLSVGWVNAGPYDGTGYICEAVNEAHDAGIIFTVSAGNQADRHYQGYYQTTDGDKWHDFSPGDEAIQIYAHAGEIIQVFLSWSADWPTNEDYDLYLRNDKGRNVAGSVTDQAGSASSPIEGLAYYVTKTGTYYVRVYDYSTTASWELELFSFNHDFLTHNVPESSIMIPADAEGALTAGATYWADDLVEYFSSRGPTNDGRVKPDMTAPDGVTSSVYGSFYGTSSSAPHTAGAAALLLQNHKLPPDQIQSALENNAVDLGDPGKDNTYGSGRIDVYQTELELNLPPTVSDPSPIDGATDVPISTPSLSFTISDPEGHPMGYTVTTTHNIGSGSATGISDGTYSITVADLDFNTPYTWVVSANDGINTPTMETYSFTTEMSPGNHLPEVSDLYPADGATDIPISTTELSFTLYDPDDDLMLVMVSTLPSIGDGSWVDGTNGEYTVPVSDLESDTLYTWYLNVYDGTDWINEEYTFTTESSSNVDPSVVYLRVWGYPGGQLDPGGSIARGNKVRVYSQVKDPETASSALTVYLSYRPEGGEWVRQQASYYTASSYWYIDWTIPMDAATGLYDTRVEVSDSDDGSAELVETGEFTVTNAAPSVGYLRVWGYPGGQLDPGGAIARGNKVRVYSRVTDLETPSTELTVYISYRPQGGEWVREPASYYAPSNYWYIDWVIPLDAETGLYGTRVEVSDPDDGSAELVETGEFTVTNAAPYVGYLRVWGYPGGQLDPSGDIARGDMVRLYSKVSDPETPSNELTVYLSYKNPSGTWTRVLASYYAPSNYWYVDWVIPGEAELGLYDTRVEVSDPDGGSKTLIETGEFNVI